MILQHLDKKGLLPGMPPFLLTNTHFLSITGSHAYGVADTSVKSKLPDFDVYGWGIPPKSMVFPHLAGHIPGFGPEPPNFQQWQKHHILETDALGGTGKEWDFQIFSIIRYFELCRNGNPNMIDTLFTPENCILHCTQIGRLVRDNRNLFISKNIWEKFRGYAFSQLHKMKNKEPEGKRKEIVDKFSYDVKFGYHILRLLDEAQQLLETGEMNLQRAKEAMKAIRRGDWKEDDLIKWANEKASELDIAYTNSKLPNEANLVKLKELLFKCLEQHYGSLQECVEQSGWAEAALREIDSRLNEVRVKLYN